MSESILNPASSPASLSARRESVVENPWLEGRFAPVAEERTESQLQVSGQIPDELNGMYARIGPNPVQVKKAAKYHWFVGDGMVHAVSFADGQATGYRNRWIGTNAANKKLGRAKVGGRRRLSAFDVVNTNIIGHAGRIFALVEAGPLPAELDQNLQTVDRGLFDGPGSSAFSAHPHHDPATGELHAICYDALNPRRIKHIVVDKTGQVTRMQAIPVRHGPMIHDCALTASKVVIFDLPVTFSVRHLIRGVELPYSWNASHPARVGLLPRSGKADDVRWFEIDPCFVFHSCNAFDLEDGSVVLDVVVHPRMFDRSTQGPEGDAGTSFERWTLNAASGRVERQVLSDYSQEFPRCDPRLETQPYRYAYSAGFDLADPAQPLYRHDIKTGIVSTHDFGPGRVPGEFVFVPRSADAAEDDGWLMGYVHSVEGSTTDLAIINAADFGGELQAMVHLPVRVPMGFHGNWIPTTS